MKEKRVKMIRQCCLMLMLFLYPFLSINAQEKIGDKSKEETASIDLLKLRNTTNVLMGVQDKQTSLYSISTVQGARMLHRPTFMMESSFDGALPGLTISSSQGYITAQKGMNLRGRTPLIVVDGVPRSDVNLPASQIESISVIKDGLGLAMMGLTSGNGVVYITTKRGDNTRLKIGFTAQLAFAEQMNRPKYLNSYEYASLLNEGLANSGRTLLYSQRDLELYRSGESPYTHANVDWFEELMKKRAPIQQYNLNFSGGSKTARFYIDLNVFDQAGFLKQDKSINTYDTQENFKKYSLRTNTDINLTKNTLLKVDLFGQIFRENTPGKAMMGSIYKGIYTTPNNAYPVTNPDGSLGGTPLYRSQNLKGQSMYTGYYFYPKTDFNLDVSLKHDFKDLVDGLYAEGKFSYNSSYREQLNRTKNFEVRYYSKGADDLTPVPDMNSPEWEDFYNKYYTVLQSSSTQKDETGYSRLTKLMYGEAAIGYDKTIGKHTTKNKVVYSYSDFMLKALNLPFVKHGVSYKSQYDYDQKYLAEIVISGMNLNQLKPGERWGWFPALGLGWNITKEDWFESSAIDNLKIRATYGVNGNDRSGSYYRSASGTLSDYYYRYLKYYSKGTDVNFGKTPSANATLKEESLPYITKWEKAKRLTVGADVEMFDKTFSATVEFFHNRYSDILRKRASSNTNSLPGIDFPNENIGEYWQNGLEFSLSYNNKFGDLSVFANLNATFYKTELRANGENQYPEAYMQQVGKPYNQIFGYVADGFFQNQADIDSYLSTTKISDYNPMPGDLKYRDLNNDGIIDGKDIKQIGTTKPKIEYGFYLGFEWKGLELNTQWSGMANTTATVKDMPFVINDQKTFGQAETRHLDYWREDNPNASYPRIYATANSYNERTSSFWVKSTSFLRLKNIELGYNLPSKWTSALGLSGIKVFANGYNLLTITGLKDRDPELLNRMISNDEAAVPNIKAFNFGLNVQF